MSFADLASSLSRYNRKLLKNKPKMNDDHMKKGVGHDNKELKYNHLSEDEFNKFKEKLDMERKMQNVKLVVLFFIFTFIFLAIIYYFFFN